MFGVLVAVIGTGLKAGIFEIGTDSRTSEQLQRPLTRTVLFLVGIGFLVLALATRDHAVSERQAGPSFSIPIPNPSIREEPKLELSKGSGPPGTRLRVTGSGFQAGETVRIEFHTETMKDVQANTEGVFREIPVEIPADWAFTGQFDITAEGLQSIRDASQPFRVDN